MHQGDYRTPNKVSKRNDVTVVNSKDPTTLDPMYDISNEREAAGELFCFTQNDSIAESYRVTGLVWRASRLYLFQCIILSVPSFV
jgi:hypothetical protein